jgi:ligand-binding sensor domain-containing protein
MINKNNYKAFYTLLYIVTVSLLMVARGVHAHDLRFNVTRLSAKDGLSCNTINSVQQDRDGFIWLSTPDGMSRYDGYQFQNFSKFNNNVKQRNYSSIAQLISDNTNGQIWGYTPNNILCCYDLEAARFSDYFDLDASTTLLSSRFQSSKGAWISSADFGVRFIYVKEGKMQSIDFTPQNGKLLDTHKLNIQEDGKNNIWIASEKGVNLITPDFKSRVILKNKKILVMTCEGSRIAVLTDQGEAFLYNDQAQLIKHSQLPSMLGFVGKSRASFFWQGWWYIFTQDETFAMDLKTGKFHKPALQIPNAMDKNQLKSYHFLYDKQGYAYLFGKHSALFKKFHLLDNPIYINARDKNFVAAESQDKKV